MALWVSWLAQHCQGECWFCWSLTGSADSEMMVLVIRVMASLSGQELLHRLSIMSLKQQICDFVTHVLVHSLRLEEQAPTCTWSMLTDKEMQEVHTKILLCCFCWPEEYCNIQTVISCWHVETCIFVLEGLWRLRNTVGSTVAWTN